MAVKLRWIDARSGNELGPGLVLEGKDVILRDLWVPEKEPEEVTLYQEEG